MINKIVIGGIKWYKGFGNSPKFKMLWQFEIFDNTGSYGAGISKRYYSFDPI